MTWNLLREGHINLNDNGKHIDFGVQHELTTQTDVFDEHVFVRLLHGSKIENKLPGAQ